jgi:hypothetical protein
MRLLRRLLVAAGAVSLLVPVGRSTAQEPEALWQAWVGCWETAADAAAPLDAAGAGMVCVVPTADPSAVEIVSVEGGTIASRSEIRADDSQHPVTRDGCTGWESAAWSPATARVYLRSEYSCEGGIERKSTGMMAFAPGGDWIDVRAVSAGNNSGVHVVRYRPIENLDRVPAELAAGIAERSLATSTARVAATGRVTPEDVIEVSTRVDPLVTEAWLVERDQAFSVDAATLTRLADAGVPTRVIDVVVALAYPEVFALDDAAREGAGRRPLPPVWDPWGFPGYGGYYPYYGRGGWYGGYPTVIVVRRPDGAGSSGGKAVKGRGYSRGNSDGGSSQPTARPSSGGDASRSGGGGSGSSTGRKAKPRD